LGLLRKGVPPDLIDDALQDAALQAWRRPERFDSFGDLLRWATKVARHVVTAEYRRRQRFPATAVLDITDVLDPARIVEGRFKLQAVKGALAQLSENQRFAVLWEVGNSHPIEPVEYARVKEQRHRGRQKLRKVAAWATEDVDASGPSEGALGPSRPSV